MKNYFLILLSFISISAHSNSCVYKWDLSAHGIFIGTMNDTITKNNNTFSIYSVFAPSSLASILGAPKIEREAIIQNGLTIKRKEHLFNKNNDTYQWEKINTTTWLKQSNDEPNQEINIQDNLIIDSTSFPYLFITKSLNYEFTAASTAVLSKNDFYTASLTLQKYTQDEYQLKFTNKNKKGVLNLDSKNNPLYFTFTDGTEILQGKLNHKSCDQ